MNYEAAMNYMVANRMCISCPTLEDRKVVIDQILKMDPGADIYYMNESYSSEDWPYALPKINPCRWVLCVLGDRTPITIADFFELCGCGQQPSELSFDLTEVI